MCKKILLGLLVVWIIGGATAIGLVLTGKIDKGSVKAQVKETLIYARDRAREEAKPTPKGCDVPDRPPDVAPPVPLAPAVHGTPKIDQCGLWQHDIDIDVVVDGTRDTAERKPAFTGFMVPFARAKGVRSVDGLVVLDAAGQEVPAQFEVLSRWDAHPTDCDAPIRHAYAHVLAAPAPKTRARFKVKQQHGFTHSQPALKIDETADRWTIEAAGHRFTVRRDRFEGLSKVERLTGSEAITLSEGGGFVAEHGGVLSAAHAAPWRVDLERRGPYVATVVARGFYGSAAVPRDLGFTVRLHFYAHSPTVRIEHTYYHGAVEGPSARQVANVTKIDRVFMSLPLAYGVAEIQTRGDEKIHERPATASVKLEQIKRTGEQQKIRFEVTADAQTLESGVAARHPFIAMMGERARVLATIGHLAVREPQALRWDAASKALMIDFTSSPLMVGGARGIWSIAAVDFDTVENRDRLKADHLQTFLERPKLGAVAPDYLHETATIGPYASKRAGFKHYYGVMNKLHDDTVKYFIDEKVTGIQVWPDLPPIACYLSGGCTEWDDETGNNYWNWSKPGFDMFFTTGDDRFALDFSIAEAITFAETLAIRPDHDRLSASSVTGLAACYGASRDADEKYHEGVNSRDPERCPGDYSYSKHLSYAYLATADRRFVDYFEEAAAAAIEQMGGPEVETVPYLEVTIGRLSEQRLENVMNGAEFARDKTVSDNARKALRGYVDLMLDQTLLDGHLCDTSGTGLNSACALHYCESTQAWMVPTPLSFLIRAGRFLSHRRLLDWVVAYGRQAAANHTAVDAAGRPDIGAIESKSADNAKNGWRTLYSCRTTTSGIVADSCRKLTDVEAEGYFYPNGLIAFLSVFGQVLSVDDQDVNKACEWLPKAWAFAEKDVQGGDLNDYIWGKPSGQALAYSAEAVGAISRCK